MRVLIVEDEKNLRTVLQKRLVQEGYSVDAVDNGLDAKKYIEAADYDAVLLDIMLPKLDGLTVLKQIREKNNKTPIMLLTARDSVEDRVKGLDYGADDYLIKPFAFEELLARLRVLTRKQYNASSSILQCADVQLDTAAKKVVRDGKPIELSAKEFAILEYLMQNQDRVLSRSNIEEHVWSYDYEGSSNVIDVYIRYLRKKLDDDFAVKRIQTVRGFGYTFKSDDSK